MFAGIWKQKTGIHKYNVMIKHLCLKGVFAQIHISNSIIIEYWSWKGPTKDHLSPIPGPAQGSPKNHVFKCEHCPNVSWTLSDWNCAHFPEEPVPVSLWVKNIFLNSNLNLSWQSFMPLLWVARRWYQASNKLAAEQYARSCPTPLPTESRLPGHSLQLLLIVFLLAAQQPQKAVRGKHNFLGSKYFYFPSFFHWTVLYLCHCRNGRIS